jgi:hypothetical protein
LKENNLRIHFDDTSTAASYPDREWRIIINDSANGGSEYFGVEDATAGFFPFRIFGDARSNALVVDAQGDIGVGTSTPVGDVHIKTGDSPFLRLEQDGTSGFTPQTWDVAGNETNFFVRDATNGSALPFKIKPAAPTNSLFVASTSGDVGVGTGAPAQALHVRRSGSPNVSVRITNDLADWDLRTNTTGQFAITRAGSGVNELIIDDGTGEVTVQNDFTVVGTKNFAMVDPADSSRWIYYSALEGPEAGTYFRGTARIVGGRAVIELPEHFSKVTEMDGLTVQLTPLGAWHQLYVAEKSPQRLIVRDAAGGDGSEFDFIVQGVRLGYADFQVDRPAPEGR